MRYILEISEIVANTTINPINVLSSFKSIFPNSKNHEIQELRFQSSMINISVADFYGSQLF